MHSLLGRDPIDIDPDGCWLTDRTVLITGAGGSIGSELARQVHGHHPAKLVLLGRGESTLARVAADLPDATLVLADIRDLDRLVEIFIRYEPDVVLHAAALKHVDILQEAPGEAVETNIRGTLNVLQVSALCGVTRLVNISTDKACNPGSVLGATKRIAERLTASHATNGYRRWVSVRFGNVLGSRGSVLGTFARQIAVGDHLTVTHPDVDRYFMTAQEACSLVIHAGAVGQPGETLILDMGAPVRIVDLAERMAALAGKSGLPIVYVGLRPGERLHEQLIGDTEEDTRPSHPLITQVPVPPLSLSAVEDIDVYVPRGELAATLTQLARTAVTS
jgi:FlaA1/EpsC-like NDP-sugar epimerase